MMYCSLKRQSRFLNDTRSGTTLTNARTSLNLSRRDHFPFLHKWFQFMVTAVMIVFLMKWLSIITKARHLNTLPNHHLYLYMNVTTHSATSHQDKLELDPSTNVVAQTTTNNVIVNPNKSSVDYMACCGAGHRLSKMADAHFLAQRLKFTLRGYWGYCDTTTTNGVLTEVFHHLFGPQSIPMFHDDADQNHYARINNDVPGFHKLMRDGKHCNSCNIDKARSDYEFYANIRDRFRLRQSVDEYYQNQLQGMSHRSNRTIVGMHIRAGNGESGDFAERGRNINNTDVWLENIANLLVTQSRIQNWNAPILFVATDTPALVNRLQNLLEQMKKPNESTIIVANRDQFRSTEGSGVLFGQQGNIQQSGVDCLYGWEDTIVDMMLLSHVDVLIAARPSSFIQSLPMSLILGRDESSRRFKNPYCEVNIYATEMHCFHNFSDWCCRGRTAFALHGIQRYEYLRMPGKLFDTELNSDDPSLQKKLKIQPRPENGCVPLPAGSKQICLPFDWSEFVVTARPFAMDASKRL